MSIQRGTTPIHTFETSIDLTDAEVVFITYQQLGKTVLEKTKEDLEITDKDVKTHLTQKETLVFDSKYKVDIQIRVKFADGSALASQIMTTDVNKLLKGGEI